MPVKSISIRLDAELLHKFHVVADYKGRSANAEAVYLIRRAVEKFEKEHGVIDIKDNS